MVWLGGGMHEPSSNTGKEWGVMMVVVGVPNCQVGELERKMTSVDSSWGKECRSQILLMVLLGGLLQDLRSRIYPEESVEGIYSFSSCESIFFHTLNLTQLGRSRHYNQGMYSHSPGA